MHRSLSRGGTGPFRVRAPSGGRTRPATGHASERRGRLSVCGGVSNPQAPGAASYRPLACRGARPGRWGPDLCSPALASGPSLQALSSRMCGAMRHGWFGWFIPCPGLGRPFAMARRRARRMARRSVPSAGPGHRVKKGIIPLPFAGRGPRPCAEPGARPMTPRPIDGRPGPKAARGPIGRPRPDSCDTRPSNASHALHKVASAL